MSIASYKPTKTPVVASIDPSHMVDKKDVYRTATVDNAVIAPESLLVNLDGMPWAVDFYSQLIDESDDIREIDIGQNAALQQYQLTKNLELRVQGELSSSYDAATALTTVTGTAIAVQIVPAKYDYFVTDVGDREKGLFMVTSVEQKTYNNKSVHEITYTLVGYTTQALCKDRWEALEARVVKTFFFHKENIGQGGAPLLTLTDHYSAESLKIAALTILESYFSLFASISDGILLAPYGHERNIDTRLVDFIVKTIGTREAPAVHGLCIVPNDKDPFLNKPSIWTALIERQRYHLKNSLNKVALMPKQHFSSRSSFITGTAAWAMDNLFYPDIGTDNNAIETISWIGHPKHDARQLLIPVTASAQSVAYCSLDENKTSIAGVVIPIIKPAHLGGYYVLSEAFYKRESDLSLLEIVTRDLVDNKPLSMAQVLELANKYSDWPCLEKFYYGPILIMMIRMVTNGFY